MDRFSLNNLEMIEAMNVDPTFKKLTQDWYLKADEFEYSYHFTWMGMPIIQYPQDIIAMQEIIYRVQPDLVVETGVARGGSVIFYASMMKLLGGRRKVVGIDIDIRKNNREKIESHFLYPYIELIEGSSVEESVVKSVFAIAENYNKVLLVLDSNHSNSHVLAELHSYEKLIKPSSYIVVFDTRVEMTPQNRFINKPFGPGNSPMTAVKSFLKSNKRFIVDESLERKLQITECPSGYLKCID